MSKCEECGAEMRYLSPDTVMCARTYELALARYLAGDERVVTHASLQDDPLIVPKQASVGPRA